MIELDKILQDPSPNYRLRGGTKITHIVLHCPIGTDTSALATLKNPVNPTGRVSAHYLIKRDGTPIQLVDLERSAWHVGNANPFSIGIEMTDRYVIPPGQLSGSCMQNPKWMTSEQFTTVVQLVATLMQKFNIPIENVMGHNDPFLRKFGNNHQDPGPYFPWQPFRLAVAKQLSGYTDALIQQGQKALLDAGIPEPHYLIINEGAVEIPSVATSDNPSPVKTRKPRGRKLVGKRRG